MTPLWKRINDDVGAAMWRALAPLLGKGASVGATCTDTEGGLTGSPYIMTEVWVDDHPLLRAESRRQREDQEWEHKYCVPYCIDDDEESEDDDA